MLTIQRAWGGKGPHLSGSLWSYMVLYARFVCAAGDLILRQSSPERSSIFSAFRYYLDFLAYRHSGAGMGRWIELFGALPLHQGLKGTRLRGAGKGDHRCGGELS